MRSNFKRAFSMAVFHTFVEWCPGTNAVHEREMDLFSLFVSLTWGMTARPCRRFNSRGGVKSPDSFMTAKKQVAVIELIFQE